MTLRHCNMGNHEVPIEEFYIRGTKSNGEPRYQSGCKDCNRNHRKQHYKENKAYYKNKAKKYKANIAKKIASLKQRPCVDCNNEFHPVCMDFDHKHDKEFEISQAASKSKEALEKELDKCELVCSNCHRLRTFGITPL